MRSGRMPSLSHHTERWLSPARPRDENGVPLSVRMTFGRPNVRNAASNTPRAPTVFVLSRPSHARRYRLWLSVIVSGYEYAPVASRIWPLKSAHHTPLGAVPAVRGPS